MKHLIFLLALLLPLCTAFAAGRESVWQDPFPDVTQDYLYAESIDAAKKQELIEGNEDGNFNPHDAINRMEFVTMMMRPLWREEANQVCHNNPEVADDQKWDCWNEYLETKKEHTCDIGEKFTDVPSGQWYETYLCDALDKNIITGHPDGRVNPAGTLQLVEAAKVLALLSADFSQEELSEAEVWHEPYVRFLASKGAIPPTVRYLSKELTRGEVIEMLIRNQKRKYGDNMNFDAQYYLQYEDLERNTEMIPEKGKEYFERDITDTKLYERDSYGHYTLRVHNPTYQKLSNLWGRDKNFVYYFPAMRGSSSSPDLRILERANATEFTMINEQYAKDGRYVFQKIQMYEGYHVQMLPDADPATFEPLGLDYSRDTKNVYYQAEISSADRDTFVYLGHEWAKDAQHVYYREEIIPGADASTFTIEKTTVDRNGSAYPIDDYDIALGKDAAFVYTPQVIDDWGGRKVIISDREEKEIFWQNRFIEFASIEYPRDNYTGSKIYPDPATFEPLSDSIARDKNHVFWFTVTHDNNLTGAYVIADADPESFEILDSIYFRDKNAVYSTQYQYQSYSIAKILEADPKTFGVHKHGFASDANHFFYRNTLLPVSVDIASLVIADSHRYHNDIFYKDKNFVFFSYYGNMYVLEDANPETFIPKFTDARRLSTDGENVYYYFQKLPNIDPDNIQKISDKYYASDDTLLFLSINNGLGGGFEEIIVTPAVDVKNITTFAVGRYATDGQRVFYKAKPIPNTDPETFSVIFYQENGRTHLSRYARDASSVYFYGAVVPDADPQTFEIALENPSYGKDKNSIFFEKEKIEDADANTLELFPKNWRYAKDNNAVYREGEIIPGADPVTFEILEQGYAKDANNVYRDGKILEGVDPKTFQL